MDSSKYKGKGRLPTIPMKMKVFDNRVKTIEKKCSKCGKKFKTKGGAASYDWCPKCHGIDR